MINEKAEILFIDFNNNYIPSLNVVRVVRNIHYDSNKMKVGVIRDRGLLYNVVYVHGNWRFR